MSMHTTDRATATQYSGVKERAPLPMILELEVGSVDRGASIRDFSQYPHEDEYLFVPLCFVEPAGPRRLEVTEKSVLHITPVRDARVGPILPPLPGHPPPSTRSSRSLPLCPLACSATTLVNRLVRGRGSDRTCGPARGSTEMAVHNQHTWKAFALSVLVCASTCAACCLNGHAILTSWQGLPR
jgi:hypothetical protein